MQELGQPARVARVCDVSIAGCRLLDIDLPVGAEIWVAIGVAAPRRARVVWLRKGEAGCAFYALLSRAELRNLLLGRP